MNFDFDSAVKSSIETVEKKTYQTDERFYTLKKDEKGEGAALIRFLPSEIYENGSMSTMKVVYKYNVRALNSKRFIAEWSPSTIGKSDPIQEIWQRLWNEGKKEESKRYARSTRYITNIKVINDPKAPENNGKIFLLDMSKTLAEKIKSIISPAETDIALGKKAKNLYNPLNGYNFMLVAKIGTNGMTTYDFSDAVGDPSAIYGSVEEATKEIQEKCYKLSDWDKPEAYPTYEELKAKLDALENGTEVAADTQNAQSTQVAQSFVAQEVTAAVATPAQPTQPIASPTNDLNSLIASLGK